MWFQRRSLNKPTWPGMIDNFVSTLLTSLMTPSRFLLRKNPCYLFYQSLKLLEKDFFSTKSLWSNCLSSWQSGFNSRRQHYFINFIIWKIKLFELSKVFRLFKLIHLFRIFKLIWPLKQIKLIRYFR